MNSTREMAASCALEQSVAPAPSSGWTGGQYSAFRALFGAVSMGWFALLGLVGSGVGGAAAADGSALSAGPPLPVEVAGSLTGLSLLLLLGWHDRAAALLLLLGQCWLAFDGLPPTAGEASVAQVGAWALAAVFGLHAMMTPAPFGSLAAAGRLDPGGDWRHARGAWVAGWVLLPLGLTVAGALRWHAAGGLDGHSGLDGPALMLLLAVPLALVALQPRLRPAVWLALLAMQLLLPWVGTGLAPSLGLLLLHAFTFDPAWIAARGGSGPSVLFFDGNCGLCHGLVRLLLAEDASGERFRFAPLQGETLAARRRTHDDGPLPDSLLVLTPCGDLLMRSDGVLHALRRLGGGWRALAGVLRLLPRPLRDLGYDGVARVRKTLFRQPAALCPLVPQRLAERLLP